MQYRSVSDRLFSENEKGVPLWYLIENAKGNGSPRMNLYTAKLDLHPEKTFLSVVNTYFYCEQIV